MCFSSLWVYHATTWFSTWLNKIKWAVQWAEHWKCVSHTWQWCVSVQSSDALRTNSTTSCVFLSTISSLNVWQLLFFFLPSSLSLYKSGSAVPLWWMLISAGTASGTSSWVAPMSSSFCSFLSYRLRVDAERTSRREKLINCMRVIIIQQEHLKEVWRHASVHSTCVYTTK